MAMLCAPVQFFTTGFGDWRRMLPAGPVREFYTQIYPNGRRWEELPTSMLEACRAWVQGDFARADGDRLTPTIPILTSADRKLLQPWVDALAAHTTTVVGDALPAFRRLVEQFRNRWNRAEHLLPILILWTINLWVLRPLLAGPMGRHPVHGDTGRYFIWGEQLGNGPIAITGIRAMRGSMGYNLCVIISRLVDRPRLKDARRLYAQVGGVSAVDLLAHLTTDQPSLSALAQQWGLDPSTLQHWLAEQRSMRLLTTDEPPQVCIPVFDSEAMAQIGPVCGGVARHITRWLLEDASLEPLVEQCSFARYPRPAVLCMLWHNSYYEATDRLIAQGILPSLPSTAEGEWGVWLTSEPYGPPLQTIDSIAPTSP